MKWRSQEEAESGQGSQSGKYGRRGSEEKSVNKGGRMFGIRIGKSIVGLDVGSSSIKAVELKHSKGEIEVAHLGWSRWPATLSSIR